MFKFESEDIKALFTDLVLSTTGEEPCYDPHLAANYDSPTDSFVEPWSSRNGVSAKKAAALCEGCDVLDKCAAYAIAAKEPFGIWGGTRPSDRGVPPKFKG